MDSTVGFVAMKDNLFSAGGKPVDGDALGYKPDYDYNVDFADADNAWIVRTDSGAQ